MLARGIGVDAWSNPEVSVKMTAFMAKTGKSVPGFNGSKDRLVLTIWCLI